MAGERDRFLDLITSGLGMNQQGRTPSPAAAVQVSQQSAQNTRSGAPVYAPPPRQGYSAAVAQFQAQQQAAQQAIQSVISEPTFGLAPKAGDKGIDDDAAKAQQKALLDAMNRGLYGVGGRPGNAKGVSLANDLWSSLVGRGMFPSLGIGQAQDSKRLTDFNEPPRNQATGEVTDPSWGMHNGIDFAADPGTPILAPEGGMVRAEPGENRGLWFNGQSGIRSAMGHVGRFATAPGQPTYVPPGGIMGYAGEGYTGQTPSAGWGQGRPGDVYDDHLHYSTAIPKRLQPNAEQSKEYVGQRAGLYQDPSGYLGIPRRKSTVSIWDILGF